MQSLCLTIVASLLCLTQLPAQNKAPGLKNSDPLSPKQELATFKIIDGFKVELVASEPDVIDPVAMAFDENGRIYVAEMHGYPNKGVGTGTITSGRIRLLEDRDGDGRYEKSTVFADELRLPTSVMPWKGGVIVAVAPEIIYLKDTNGDGKADQRRVLYNGFGLSNIQQMINGLQWGMDNWVYGSAGNNGGTTRSPENPKMKPVSLRGRGVRFKPGVPGSLEPTSGGGQFGVAADEWQRWFTATNSQHLRQIVLPDHYLRRNPFLPVRAVTINVPDHGASCKVHRISPFEAWRVERTRRRKTGPTASRFSPTELVPGGFSTSTCSPLIYLADFFPKSFHGQYFVCDPANNLIHGDVLVPNGAIFSGKRADKDCEFLASTDNWFRPVFITIGPDGAIYVLDFYREVIETPLSLPDDIKARVNLQSRKRGRVWRIVPSAARKKPKKPRLGKAPSKELVGLLSHPNVWWRLTAQRLLIERKDMSIVQDLKKMAIESRHAIGRAHAMWTLRDLRSLDDELIERALRDKSAGLREHALRLSEERLAKSAVLREAVAKLADDDSPRVRFQAAFTLGEADDPQLVRALAKVMLRDVGDSWTQTAVLSSATETAPELLAELMRDKLIREKATSAHLRLLRSLASLVGARSSDKQLSPILESLTSGASVQAWQTSLLEGLGQGLRNRGSSLGKLWTSPTLKSTMQRLSPFFEQAVKTSQDAKQPVAARVEAIRLLTYGPFEMVSDPLRKLLAPQHPTEAQLAAVGAISQQRSGKVAGLLLQGWNTYSPKLRREVSEALFAQTDRLTALLDAIEKKQISPAQIEPTRIAQLRKHSNAGIRKRADMLLAKYVSPSRRSIVEKYRDALELKADVARGRMLFQKNCATCHRLENKGTEVGPDLVAVMSNKTGDQLLLDVLDPSREVDSRYVNYVVRTKKGRTLTGMIAAETGSSITLRRAEKVEETVLRRQIEEIESTGQSLMPEGLEKMLMKQDFADLVSYLKSTTSPK